VAWETFANAASCFLKSWTTLALAVKEEWGGEKSAAKADELLRCILEVFHDVATQKAKPVEENEIEDFLFDSMENDFRTKTPEGEVEAVASTLLELFRQCSKGNFALAQKIVASYRPPPVEQSVRGQAPAPPEMSNEMSDAVPAAPPAPQQPAGPQEIREPPVDEWIVVTKGKGGKKGGK
jgi:pre-rRNA-processing protein TSR2